MNGWRLLSLALYALSAWLVVVAVADVEPYRLAYSVHRRSWTVYDCRDGALAAGPFRTIDAATRRADKLNAAARTAL